MHVRQPPQLTLDELDDCLYFSRVNEAEDLWQTIGILAEKYQCPARDIILAARDPESENTILHYCCANGFLDLLKGLLSRLDTPTQARETDRQTALGLINTPNKQGNTALHWASLNGHLDVVKSLVAAGADTSSKNAAEHTAAFEAEQAGKGLVVEYLLEVSGLEMDEEDVAEVPNGSSNGAAGHELSDDVDDLHINESGPSG